MILGSGQNFDLNTGAKTYKIQGIFESNVSYFSYFKRFIGLGFNGHLEVHSNLGTGLQR